MTTLIDSTCHESRIKDSVNILLVDDDIRNLDVLESVLTMPDYRLFRARSADEALLALVREEFAVIVLDVRMPDLSGYELAQMIKRRKRTQHVPIIFLTAYYGEDEDVLQGYGAGAVDYLSKPVNPLILRSKVAVLVDLFRKTRILETMNRAMEAEIEERLAQLKASLHEKDTLLREVHHRVKNNLQIVSSLIDLQAARQKGRDVQALFRDARDRVRSMALVHEKLYQSEDLAQTELGTYTKNLMKELFQAHGEVSSKIRLNMQLEPVRLPVDRAIPCGLILNELATNSLKHAFIGRQEGLIEICLTCIDNRSVRLVFQDDGKGFPSGFDWHATESLGLRLVRMLSEQLRADLRHRNGSGTTFEICFDIHGIGIADSRER
ncbi:sensor histidine kinase [Candidatus Nitrospira nitrificans]|uniref:histidine kinase n=1 Tax=Candidatus Nitrospira nitrificans TaxID=1742973 RepID=A0A0S4LR90_9BACT|nr:histidine kinase dimerization/phosphoacceptor domain -containing protein [Candidatus Nitrospira nitrificans]CUS39136.1 Histidine kinase [Candidatus Nitrospira nitrificans]